MHIAICVWGIVRSLRFTMESIEHYCLNPITNAGHTYEIYMHTYKFSGVYVNKRNNEHGLRLNFSEWKMLNPDHIYVEDQDLFDANMNYSEYQTLGDPWRNNYESFRNHLRALSSLHYLATEVEKDSHFKHFDGIVYLRPDVTYLNELPFYLLEHIPNTLFLPDFHRSCKGGEYNDRMAMGDLKSGLLYGKRFESALEYSKSTPLHSEKFTYNYLHANNVTVKEIPFRFRRTRANGQYHIRDEKAIVAPRNQNPAPEYTTFFALRWIYTLMEIATEHKVYIWNHDDDENLYCKPNPYISPDECRSYRKRSRRKRLDAEAGIRISRSISSVDSSLPAPLASLPPGTDDALDALIIAPPLQGAQPIARERNNSPRRKYSDGKNDDNNNKNIRRNRAQRETMAEDSTLPSSSHSALLVSAGAPRSPPAPDPAAASRRSSYDPAQDHLHNLQRDLARDAAAAALQRRRPPRERAAHWPKSLGGLGEYRRETFGEERITREEDEKEPPQAPLPPILQDFFSGIRDSLQFRGMATRELEEIDSATPSKKTRHLRTHPA